MVYKTESLFLYIMKNNLYASRETTIENGENSILRSIP
jgi:hypothetical protein